MGSRRAACPICQILQRKASLLRRLRRRVVLANEVRNALVRTFDFRTGPLRHTLEWRAAISVTACR
jgi:hypothetical protein